MKSFFKNLIWLLGVVIISFFSTYIFGSIGSNFTSQDVLYARIFSVLIVGSVGGSLSFIFFITFFFSLCGFKKYKYWITIPLIPYLMLWLLSDIREIYIPIIFGFVGFVLAFVVRKIFFKRYSTPLN